MAVKSSDLFRQAFEAVYIYNQLKLLRTLL